MRIAVLAGGRSAEREVSQRSGNQVSEALQQAGHATELVELDRDTWDTLRDGAYDCVFIALHGRLGEDGTVQGMLELLDLPYTGSGVLASALCIDKSQTNRLLAEDGMLVPDFEELSDGVLDAELAGRLVQRYGLPLVIKPVREGSTIGLTVAGDEDEVASGLVLAARFDARVMVQRFVAGVEVTMGVLEAPGVLVFPVLEIISNNEVYDYDAKYTEGGSEHIIPARISAAAARSAREQAERAFRLLGCEGMARVDAIVDAQERVWLLEVNTIPGLTELSLFPDAARAAGLSFAQVCDILVQQAVSRRRRRVGP